MGTVNNDKVPLQVNSLVNETIYPRSHARKSQNIHLLQFSLHQFLGINGKLGQVMMFGLSSTIKYMLSLITCLPVVSLMIKEYEKKRLHPGACTCKNLSCAVVSKVLPEEIL